MRYNFTILLLLIVITVAWSQDAYIWPIKELDTAREVNYLTDDEKDMILELNKVRYNPAMYANKCIQGMNMRFEGKILKSPGKTDLLTFEGKVAYDECLKELGKSKPAPLLYPSTAMTKACRLLVTDQSSTGKTGHTGKGNSTTVDRAKRFGQFEGNYAENIHYGDSDPAFAVIALLIDDGVLSRGHRNTILDPTFSLVGAAIGSHKTFTKMFVSTFATRFTEK